MFVLLLNKERRRYAASCYCLLLDSILCLLPWNVLGLACAVLGILWHCLI